MTNVGRICLLIIMTGFLVGAENQDNNQPILKIDLDKYRCSKVLRCLSNQYIDYKTCTCKCLFSSVRCQLVLSISTLSTTQFSTPALFTTISSTTPESTTNSISTTLPTTTTTLLTTTTKMEKSKCTKFVDSNDIVKTLCITTEILDTLNAANYCMSKGMELFTIPDADHFNALRNFLTNYFEIPIPLIIGNAKNDRRNHWDLYTDSKVHLFQNIPWKTPNANANPNSCMLLSGATLQAAPYDCTQRGIVICEL